jgi:hypothetical protein
LRCIANVPADAESPKTASQSPEASGTLPTCETPWARTDARLTTDRNAAVVIDFIGEHLFRDATIIFQGWRR